MSRCPNCNPNLVTKVTLSPLQKACFRIADSGNVNFDFINKSDPEEGVKVLYRGGQKCRKRNTPEVIKETNETWRDVDREVEIQLMCDREMGISDDVAMTDLINSGATINVEEKSPPDECQYVVRWRTQHGCPQGGSYAKVSSGGPVYASGPNQSGGWLWWLFRMIFMSLCGVVVVVLVLSMGQIKKRFQQYQQGNFLGFGDFLGYVVGDVSVRMRQLIGGGGSAGGALPTMSPRGSGGGHFGGSGHLHDI